MSTMRSDESGAISIVSLVCIVLGLVLVVVMIIASSIYSSEQKYKNQSDQLVASAVNIAKQQQLATDTNQFAQDAKQPLVTYVGPEAFGTVTLKYPKTWSAYIVESSSNQQPVDGYFEPGFVPDVSNSANIFALRLEIVGQPYDQAVKSFSGQVLKGTVSVVPYSLPKVPSVIGVEVKGTIIGSTTSGIMIILPLRNSTLEVFTEGSQYQSDFTSLILPNLSFSP